MMFLAALLIGWADSAEVDLSLSARGSVGRLRLVIAINGQPPGHDWDRFLDRLFDQADANGNQVLSSTEAQRVFPVSMNGGKSTGLDFARADGNRDAKVSREEFRAHYRQIGFRPVATVYRPPTLEPSRLGAALFSHLDRDGDGVISAEEWKAAPGLMARFDENEDEILDPQELVAHLPLAGGDHGVLQSPWAVTGGKSEARMFIDLGDRPEAKLESSDPFFQPGPVPQSFQIPGGILRIKLDAADPVRAFRSKCRDFFLAQFGDAAGKKLALKKSELEADPSLAAIGGLFFYADRNGDGILSAAELEGLFDLVEMGIARQAVLVLENRGQNLFDGLDANGDGRLDGSELMRAGTREALKRQDIPWSYQLRAARGPAENRFGPLRVPIGGVSAEAKTVAPARSAPKGPDWFVAMDKNQDGLVSRAEFRGRPEVFDRLDRDKDGQISMVEALAAGR
jgi:Ca2+-binding EF-hand superfamily protein